jgi:hypothetical protein
MSFRRSPGLYGDVTNPREIVACLDDMGVEWRAAMETS